MLVKSACVASTLSMNIKPESYSQHFAWVTRLGTVLPGAGPVGIRTSSGPQADPKSGLRCQAVFTQAISEIKFYDVIISTMSGVAGSKTSITATELTSITRIKLHELMPRIPLQTA